MRSNAVHKNLSIVAAILSVVVLFTAGADAQSTRKRQAVRPIPAATPPAGDAEVIKRADDPVPQMVFVDPQSMQKSEPQPPDDSAQKIKDLNARIKKLEANRTNEYDEKQKRLMLNLDILTRAEQRSEGLRKQLFEMIEKENTIKSRIDQIETDSRPEIINRAATFSGSMKPEEVRELRKRSLDAEKQNLLAFLTEVQSTRANLTANVQRSDAMVEKLRAKLEKDIDESFLKDDPDQ